jgi:asparagine synthase (glutamine-hydrolysing)
VFADDARGSADAFNLSLFNAREFNAAARARLYAPGFASALGPSHAEAYFLGLMAESADEVGPDPVEQALRTDTLMYLPDTLLVKVDIAAMAVSLETRSPLLDTAIMEFAASLPRAWKVTRAANKKILKEAHEGLLPREVLYRRKMGFSVPLAHWFRHELYGYTRDLLLADRSIQRGYFQRESVEALIDDHRAGRQNNASRLWALVMLEHWHREILEARPSAAASIEPVLLA